MSDALVEFFARLPLFAPLSRDELLELIRGIQPIQVPAGQHLMRQGDPADAMYVVDTGTLAVELEMADGRAVEVDRVGPGAIIGDLGLIDGRPRTAGIRAVEDARLLRVDRAEFEYLLRNDRPAAYKIVRAICQTVCERMRRAEAEIQGLLDGGKGGLGPEPTPTPTPAPGARPEDRRLRRFFRRMFGGSVS